jgi:hypothetical protein
MIKTFEVSVRVNQAGPPVRDEVNPVDAASQLNGSATALILIHGYNVSISDARKVYSGFIDAMNTLSGTSLSVPICQFMWPGDESNPIWSTVSYAGKIDVALDSGRVLGEFLSQLHGPRGSPINLHIVAHSLGNRVLMALLKRVGNETNVVVQSITMMAAAVPVELVVYPQPFFRSCMIPRRSLVLHSLADWVLGTVFPLGETVHGDAIMPTAVGWLGHPTSNWTEHKAYNTFLHGQYWSKSGPSSDVAALLGIATPRATASNAIPSRETQIRKLSRLRSSR